MLSESVHSKIRLYQIKLSGAAFELGLIKHANIRDAILLHTVPIFTALLHIFILTYRISSNNSRGRLFLFSHQKGAIIRGKAIIRGRRLFHIFLTGGRTRNILFYYTIKSKN